MAAASTEGKNSRVGYSSCFIFRLLRFGGKPGLPPNRPKSRIFLNYGLAERSKLPVRLKGGGTFSSNSF